LQAATEGSLQHILNKYKMYISLKNHLINIAQQILNFRGTDTAAKCNVIFNKYDTAPLVSGYQDMLLSSSFKPVKITGISISQLQSFFFIASLPHSVQYTEFPLYQLLRQPPNVMELV
jgi:hypothetical protein